MEKKVAVISALVEGCSIRSTVRMTGVAKGTILRLLAEVGQACLEFHRSKRAMDSASSEQVRRPIYDDAVDQWRHYESWLGPLKVALGPVLEAYPGLPPFAD